MEHRVLSELEKSKIKLEKLFESKFNGKLNKADIDFVLKSFDSSMFQMIQLMKEGKSTHEKFFSDIILNSIDAIIGIDNDSKIFLWNKGAESIFGYLQKEVIGKEISILTPEHLKDSGENEFMINEVDKKGALSNYETERIAKNGSTKNVSISRYALFDKKGVKNGHVCIVRDITEETKLKKELREKENLALIGEIVSSIAHNLSNPLNIISGNADYLLLDKKEGDETYEELKVILDETTRITKSIRQLLNFSKPSKVMKESCDINEFISSVVVLAEHLKGDKNVQIQKNLSKDIPVIKIDMDQMKDVFLNLINNSIQAFSENGNIIIKTSFMSDNIVITISDDGAGISKENLDKVFKPFFSTKEYGKGSGLGLAFSKRVIHEHSGEINVKSKLEEGTTFRISLPIN